MLALLPFAAAAAAPPASLPPRLRPVAVTVAVAVPTSTGTVAASSKPPRLPPYAAGTAHRVAPVRGRPARAPEFRPRLRPGSYAEIVVLAQSGALCGRRGLRGERLRPISAGPGCGIAEPVRVHSVGGVALSQPAILDCQTAIGLDDWVRASAVPAWGRLGRGLATISVGESFSCSPHTTLSSAHAAGRAVDVTGFTLHNGVSVSVAKHWRDPVAGQVLRKARDGACEVFPEVLSPDAGRATSDKLVLAAGGRRSCR